ncbi:MAG TPA: hypothetical protein VEH84_07770 [Alphaproteobacteria bacterium]|nr:hypothetical protein [Alphaproteobacteria bacterium]
MLGQIDQKALNEAVRLMPFPARAAFGGASISGLVFLFLAALSVAWPEVLQYRPDTIASELQAETIVINDTWLLPVAGMGAMLSFALMVIISKIHSIRVLNSVGPWKMTLFVIVWGVILVISVIDLSRPRLITLSSQYFKCGTGPEIPLNRITNVWVEWTRRKYRNYPVLVIERTQQRFRCDVERSTIPMDRFLPVLKRRVERANRF